MTLIKLYIILEKQLVSVENTCSLHLLSVYSIAYFRSQAMADESISKTLF